MKLNKHTLFIALALFFTAGFVNAQSCDSLTNICKDYLTKPSKKDKSAIFISDGQTYRALLDEEQTAEFTTTFFGGSTYRIAASAGTKDKYVIFDVYDKERNLLFSNMDYGNATYWDFKVESTLDVIIEARLDPNKKTSGCAVMLIGFKQIKK
ncbi:MAG: hypothetical protein K1X56_03590 [Flavobacteriales bacterium]|nr:hypothetical protein [Flavobacteriales bacterium]